MSEKQRRGGEEDGSVGLRFILLPPKGRVGKSCATRYASLKPSGPLAVRDEIKHERILEQNIF